MDTGALYRLNDDFKVLDAIKEGGFKYFDLTLFWKGVTEHIGLGDDCFERAKEFRKYADSLGLECEQSHAFFCSGRDEETVQKRIEYISKEMKIASIVGAKSIVIHPVAEFSFDENVLFINRFISLAHELNLIICVENVWGFTNGKHYPICTSTASEFVRFLDTINDPFVKACLDLGHAEIGGDLVSAVEMIENLGSRLFALHIHDNDKKNDLHQLPFTYQIDFVQILDALKRIDYQGNITFEVETCFNNGYQNIYLPFELFIPFIRMENDIGQYFVKYLDK